jgi:hypothetical protein
MNTSMSAKHTPGPDMEAVIRSLGLDEQRLYKVPALFWLDHEDRSPCNRPEEMAELQSIQNRVAYILANAVQLECLRSDAEFYAGDNVDDCKSIQRSARATLAAIAKATGSAA